LNDFNAQLPPLKEFICLAAGGRRRIVTWRGRFVDAPNGEWCRWRATEEVSEHARCT
jgi:hypothetical protein